MGCLQSKEKEKEPEPMKEPEAKAVDKRLPFESYRQFFNTKNSWKCVSRGMEKCARLTMLGTFEKKPEYKEFFPDLKKYKTEEELIESTDFEIASMGMFNQMDMFLEKAEGECDEALKALQRHGRLHSKIKGFDTAYFKDTEEPFIAACKEVMSDRFTEAAEKNLRLFYTFSAEQFTEGYNSAVGKTAGTNEEANRI